MVPVLRYYVKTDANRMLKREAHFLSHSNNLNTIPTQTDIKGEEREALEKCQYSIIL